jgi:hypothetical protein
VVVGGKSDSGCSRITLILSSGALREPLAATKPPMSGDYCSHSGPLSNDCSWRKGDIRLNADVCEAVSRAVVAAYSIKSRCLILAGRHRRPGCTLH